MEEWWASKTTEADPEAAKVAVKVAAKTTRQAQADKSGKTAHTSISTRMTVINCETDTATRTASPRLVPVYDTEANIVGMSQVPVALLKHW